ncbi:MAG: DUF4405 domain-containing protein [Thermodesulfobacteriota bacterium]
MKTNFIKYLVAASLFVDVCSIAVIGVLLAFVIPEGKAGQVSKYFLGLHRHEWGEIHLWLSSILLVLLLYHLWLNWAWIVQTTKHHFGGNWKKALWVLAGAWIVVLIFAWAVTKL